MPQELSKMKIVSYNGTMKSSIKDYVECQINSQIVKRTVSYLSEQITSEFVKAIQGDVHVFSTSNVLDTTVEGSSVLLHMNRHTQENIDLAIGAIDSYLANFNGIYEILLYMKIRRSRFSHFGLALVDYTAPENWEQ